MAAAAIGREAVEEAGMERSRPTQLERLKRRRPGWGERLGIVNNTSQETIDNYYSAIPCPYLAWRQYLPDCVQCSDVNQITSSCVLLQVSE